MLFGCFARCPLSLLLEERDSVAALLVADSHKQWPPFTSDEDLFLFVNSDVVFCENGDVAVVVYCADAA